MTISRYSKLLPTRTPRLPFQPLKHKHRSRRLTLLGSIAFLLCLNAVPGQAQGSEDVMIDKIVAKVDNFIVLQSDLEGAYREAQAANRMGNITRCQILEQLVIEKLLLAKAEIDSVVVGDDRVAIDLDRRMQYMIGNYGEETIEEQFGKTVEELKEEMRDDIRDQLVVQEMQQTITQGIEVTPAEVRKFFNAIPTDSLPFYSSEVAVAQIVKKPTVSRSQKEITRKKLLDIRERVVNGEDFGELAKEYSDDPGSAQYGGELGFVERGQFVPEFEAAALKMQPGDLSQPIESDFGFHLIELLERRGNRYSSRHILLKPNSSELDVQAAEEFLDSLRSKIIGDTVTFEKAAKEESDEKAESGGPGSGGFFISADGSNRVSTEDLDPVIFFTIDTMNVGSITQPLVYRMSTGEQAVRILYLKSKSKPHLANLREDYQKIYNAALQEKRGRLLKEWFTDARKQVYIEIDPEYDHCNVGSNI
ncbi:MAG: peptidylprolyl isomerase [Cyclobacteriaceae bacterium]